MAVDSLTFTLGAETVTFNTGRSYPIRDTIKLQVVVGYSEAGQLYAYDKGVKEQMFTLNFQNISQTDYDNFMDFFENVCVGPKYTFTFNDEDDTDHTVRMMNTEDPFSEMAEGIFSGVVTLREEIT